MLFGNIMHPRNMDLTTIDILDKNCKHVPRIKPDCNVRSELYYFCENLGNYNVIQLAIGAIYYPSINQTIYVVEVFREDCLDVCSVCYPIFYWRLVGTILMEIHGMVS